MLLLHLIAIVSWQFILRTETVIGSLQIERASDMKFFIKLISHCLRFTSIYLCAVHQAFLVAERHE